MKLIFYSSFLLFLILFSRCISGTLDRNEQKWILGPFTKMDSNNPILIPDSTLSFYCPINRKEVKWAARNVLNPAAVIKNHQVYLFFRAQDKQGTSRIGCAVSDDGINFNLKNKLI